MEKLQWLWAHLPMILGWIATCVAGLLSAMGTIKNIWTQIEKDTGRMYPKVDSKLDAIANALALVNKYGHSGLLGKWIALPGDPGVPVQNGVIKGGPSALLPFLLIGGALGMAIAASGCATASPAQKAYDAAFLACMESKGISAAGQEAWTDLSTGASQDAIYSQLEGLAGRAGVDTVTCAVTAWMGQRGAELNPAGVAAGKAWLASHQAQHAAFIPVQTHDAITLGDAAIRWPRDTCRRFLAMAMPDKRDRWTRCYDETGVYDVQHASR